jgi:hypothetical protein
VVIGLLLVPGEFWANTRVTATSTNNMSVAVLRIVNVLHVVTPQVRSCQFIAGWPKPALFFAKSSISVKDTAAGCSHVIMFLGRLNRS